MIWLLLVILTASLCCQSSSWKSPRSGSRLPTRLFDVSRGDAELVEPVPFSLACLTDGLPTSCFENALTQTDDGIAFTGPVAYQVVINWGPSGPKRVFLLSKLDPEIIPKVEDALVRLWKRGLTVFLEESTYDRAITRFGDEVARNGSLRVFDSARPGQGIDLVITFGGDGLLMHCNSLFGAKRIPPIMSFDFGSLGFLAPFCFEDFDAEIDHLFSNDVCLTLRMRLECTIWRNFQKVPCGTYHVLNEAVIDRGPASFLSVIDVACDSQYLTTVQGDGIIVATPTGSTAYSLAAGGSMVHPWVPAILLTPICAHTLSFRPLLLPGSSTISLSVPTDCRAHGWVSFDGKFRQELEKGDRLEVKVSRFPMPTINRANFTGDWFDALRSAFSFNQRPRQKGGGASK